MRELLLGVWSLAELQQVRKPSWTVGEVEFLYMVFDGRVREVLDGTSNALEVVDSIETTARWFFGLALNEAYPLSWSRALQNIRETIHDAKGKTSKDELAIMTSLFWIVHGTGGAKLLFVNFS